MRSLTRLRGVLVCLAILPACASAPDEAPDDETESGLVSGTKAWDAAAETEWSAFIAAIGEARASGRCTTVNACINDKTINTYRADADPNLDIFADCADLPMELRAYFAVKTGRPFRFAVDVVGDAPAPPPPPARNYWWWENPPPPPAAPPPDYRYTPNNHPTAWGTLGGSTTLQGLLQRISNSVHSGFFRMAPEVEKSDTYPIDIRPGTVRPGTVYYDPNGHVLMVYRVEADGTVRFIDGHPDNSLSFTIFDDRLGLGGKAQGGGFRNFRPIRMVAPNTSGFVPNAELTDLGASQYAHARGYVDWVRSQLSGGVAIKPDTKMTQMVEQLCIDVKGRIAAVDAGVHLTSTNPLPELPPNIYGADGDWEAFSTPGRDARLRASFRSIRHFVKDSVDAVKRNDGSVTWEGSAADLVARYKQLWDNSLASCTFSYASSTGASVSLSLADVQSRIYALSFDPYHCSELRWGATGAGATAGEFAACSTQDASHMQRYRDERRMRNIIDRPAAGTATPIGFGPASPEDVDVSALLKQLSPQ